MYGNSIFLGKNISATGLTAQRRRMDVIANNIANMYSTKTASGGPFQRDIVVFKEIMNDSDIDDPSFKGGGVGIYKIVKDQSPYREVYQPGHPDADEKGLVKYPNIDSVVEMVDMISASRAYEANVTAIQAAKSMMKSALSIARA